MAEAVLESGVLVTAGGSSSMCATRAGYTTRAVCVVVGLPLESRALVGVWHERLLLDRRSEVRVLGARRQLERWRREVLVVDQRQQVRDAVQPRATLSSASTTYHGATLMSV